MALETDRIKGIIWDLDNTLYQFTDKFYKSCTEAAAKAAQDLGISLSYDDTLKLAERSEIEHGYSMHGYVTDHGLSYTDLHFPFHQNIDETVIAPIDGALNALGKFKDNQVILTNASQCWAERALKFIGVDKFFPKANIIAMEDVNFEPKARSDLGFKRAAELLNLPYKNILMVDDLDRNLIIPHKMGMQTAYMNHGDAMIERPEFIDAQFDNLVSLIDSFG